MAQFLVEVDTTAGNAGNSWVRHNDNNTLVNISQINDGDAANLELTVGERVTITWYRTTSPYGYGDRFPATYRGTVEWPAGSGNKYPVVEDTEGSLSGSMYLIGIRGKIDASEVANALTTLVAETFTVCFFPGTLIATPSGERKVEELVSGDLVLVGNSGAIEATWHGRKFGRAVSVKWIGRQAVSTLFGPADRLMPVRFAAGSLGGLHIPHSDLTVTADHAMLIDGVLCEAATLVNGTTITRVPLSAYGESYTVYHVETEDHEIILANGAPAETFVDNVSRRAFDNFAEFERLHCDPSEMKELPYPRASNARHLPARIKRRLSIGGSAKPEKVA